MAKGFERGVIHTLNKTYAGVVGAAALASVTRPPIAGAGASASAGPGAGGVGGASAPVAEANAEANGTVAGARRNVLLLGDHIRDVHMADGLPCDEVLSVGFLNDMVDELLPQYASVYDVVVTEDGSMAVVRDILAAVLQ